MEGMLATSAPDQPTDIGEACLDVTGRSWNTRRRQQRYCRDLMLQKK
jgi:hypothetical protein